MTRLAVTGLSKKYCHELGRSLLYGIADVGWEILPLGRRHSLRKGEFWALDDLTFSVGEGEALAILGRNGAGKSTLLKMLYGLLKPDDGQARLRGSVGAMIELGTGLNPSLTARENIRLGAALAGIAGSEERRLVDEVLDFAELEPFVDMPFQNYSSGMKARLAYALAALVRPDILLIDEVLAVGDFHFQRKCLNHMRNYLAGGGSLLFVSHNTFQIQAICQSGLLLEKGRIAFRGTAVEAVHRMYESRLEVAPATREPTRSTAPIDIEEIRFENPDGGEIETGKPMRVRLLYAAREPIDVLWGFSIFTRDGWVCVTGNYSTRSRELQAGLGELSCRIPSLPLVAGRYLVRAVLIDPVTTHALALCGYEEQPPMLDVRAVPHRLTNAQIKLEQLVTIDVDWE